LIVTILVGLSTYLLVFNLNNIVEFCSRVYSKRKLLLIELMQTDLDKNGRKQAKNSPAFSQNRRNANPQNGR
jgi:hypothetical protein